MGTKGLEGVPAIEQVCAGAKYHTPAPLLLRRYKIGRETIWLCGTCQDRLAVLLHLYRLHDGKVPWPLRREFGNLIRAIGERAYKDGVLSSVRA